MQLDARKLLADIGESSRLALLESMSDLRDKLVNKCLASSTIAKMRSDWILGQLLDENVHDTIKHTRWHEELS